MSTYVIVPLDGSTLAEQALPLAATLAAQTGDTLLLLRVMAPTDQVQSRVEESEDATRKARVLRHHLAHHYFSQLEPRLRQAGIEIVTQVVEGTAGNMIVTTAETIPTRYVVMTTHGQSGISRWARGSVADRVLRQISCPLILLRPREPFTANYASVVPLERLLVPLDGSAMAEAVLPHVRELARRFDATIHLFRAVQPLPMAISGVEGPHIETQLRTVAREVASDYLSEVAVALVGEGFKVRMDVQEGYPAELILTRAEAMRADLVVMATHARMGLHRTLLGSVTDRVVRAGEVPVLMIPPLTAAATEEEEASRESEQPLHPLLL